MQKINKISVTYFDNRFRKENSKEFPKFLITQIALVFIILGFALQLYRLFNLEWFNEIFGTNQEMIFFIFLIPWRILNSYSHFNTFLHVLVII